MKKLVTLVIVSMFMYSSFAQLIIQKTTVRPLIDGRKTTNEPWSDNWIQLTKQFSGNTTFSMSSRFQIKYDDLYLYILAQVYDNSPGYLSVNSWENDGFEIFIALDTSSGISGAYKTGDYQFRKQRGKEFTAASDVTIGGSGLSINELKLNQGFKVSETDSGSYYTQEWQIPINDLAINMNPVWDCKQFKFEVQSIDNTTNSTGGRTQQIFWNSGSNQQWNNTKYLGLVTLPAKITDNRTGQTISFTALPISRIGDEDIAPVASASSGLQLSFISSNLNVAVIKEGKIHFTGNGTTIITAYQYGNNLYKCAVPASRTLTVKGLVIHPALKSPVIDGIINSDDPWTNDWLPITMAFSGNSTNATTASFQMAYDANNLYIISKVNDTTDFHGATNTWEDDCFEVYLVMDTTTWSLNGEYKTGDFQMRKLRSIAMPQGLEGEIGEAALLNNYGDWLSAFTGINITEVNEKKQYIQEWKLPWSALTNNMSPAWDHKQFKLDLKTNDNTTNSDNGNTQQMYWYSNSQEQWRNTNVDGLVQLSNPINSGKLDQNISFSLNIKSYGDPDFDAGATSNSSLPVTLSSSNTNVATIVDGEIHIIGAGETTITASQAGNELYNAADNVTQLLIVNKASQFVYWPMPIPGNPGLPAKSLTDSDFDPGAKTSSGLPVVYTSSNTNVITIVNGKAHITGAGSASLTATHPGDNNYLPSNSMVTLTVEVNSKLSQSISFDSIPDLTYGDADFIPVATASSGLAVEFNILDETIATYETGKIKIHKAGTTEITAIQKGNTTYNPSLCKRILQVNKAVQTTNIIGLPVTTYKKDISTLTVSVNSGLQLTITSSNPAVAMILDNVIYIVGAGLANITISQNGNESYLPLNSVIPLDIKKADQTITFTSLNAKGISESDFAPGAYSDSNLPISYSSSNTAVATILNGKIHLVATGTTSITAMQPGNNNYNTAVNVIQTLEVNGKSPQIITFPIISAKTFGDADFDPGATSNSGLTVEYLSANSEVAEIVNGKIHILKAGTTVIKATQAGNTTYNPAPEIAKTLTINKADQIISFNDLTAKLYGDADFEPGATSNSGLAISYSSSDESIVTISDGKIHIIGVGETNITASQIGNENYKTAADVVKKMIVNKGNQEITFDELSPMTYGEADLSIFASSGSGLEISFSTSDSSIAYVSNGKIHVNGSGSVQITASQKGNELYNSATDVSRNLIVKKAEPEITWNDPDDIIYGPLLGSAQLNAIANVSGSYTYNPAADTKLNAGTLQELQLNFTPLDTNYSSAVKVVKINVLRANPIITWENPGYIYYGAKLSKDQLNATANVPGSFVYTPGEGLMPDIGTYDLLAVFTPTDANNYNTVQKTVPFEVKKPNNLGLLREAKATVYPNPFISYINIKCSFTYESIAIIDIYGREIYETKFKSGGLYNISQKDLKAGSYIIVFKDKTGNKLAETRIQKL